MKNLKITLAIVSAFLIFSAPALAAVPDGSGPWADNAVSLTQGTRKDGSAVLPARSDATAALGQAENTRAEGTFVSLGFGGNIVLGFDNGVSNGVLIVESTNTPYPVETATVEVSNDQSTWTPLGSVGQGGGTVSVPQEVCARYVRLTDTSDPNNFPANGDGYDLDGVSSTGQACELPPPIPEFGLITGILTLVTSAGSFLVMKKKV